MPVTTYTHVAEFIVHGQLLGQETINRFVYGSNSFTDPLIEWITAFDNAVVSPWADLISSSAQLTHTSGQMLKGGVEFADHEYDISGHISGDCLPAFVSWDFTILRGGARERNGYKRLAGVPEASQINGVATAGAQANLAAWAVTLGTSIPTTNDELNLVIERTVINHVVQRPPVYYDFSNVIYSRIGSQNSRKPGHGR